MNPSTRHRSKTYTISLTPLPGANRPSPAMPMLQLFLRIFLTLRSSVLSALSRPTMPRAGTQRSFSGDALRGTPMLSKVWVRAGVGTGVTEGAVRLCERRGRGKRECFIVDGTGGAGGAGGAGVVDLGVREGVDADAGAAACNIGASSISARDE
jgi:hypothetical protein